MFDGLCSDIPPHGHALPFISPSVVPVLPMALEVTAVCPAVHGAHGLLGPGGWRGACTLLLLPMQPLTTCSCPLPLQQQQQLERRRIPVSPVNDSPPRTSCHHPYSDACSETQPRSMRPSIHLAPSLSKRSTWAGRCSHVAHTAHSLTSTPRMRCTRSHTRACRSPI